MKSKLETVLGREGKQNIYTAKKNIALQKSRIGQAYSQKHLHRSFAIKNESKNVKETGRLR